jgi:hypothetical protein
MTYFRDDRNKFQLKNENREKFLWEEK